MKEFPGDAGPCRAAVCLAGSVNRQFVMPPSADFFRIGSDQDANEVIEPYEKSAGSSNVFHGG